MIKFFAFVFVFFLLVGVGSVCVGQLVSDTSIISLSGRDWSLKVDGVLQSSLDSRNVPYMTSKSVSEKELFLQLATFEDCKSGVVQFKVDMLGLTSYKQLPLNLELDVKEYSFVNSTHALNNSQVVVYRPENIVNSFALFDDSGRKQAHVSASKLVASDGATVWCDSNLEGGLLTVVLPLEWLETAKFPVVLDPVFGYSNVGATSAGDHNQLWATNFTLTETAYITNVTGYCLLASDYVFGIYNNSLNLVLNVGEVTASSGSEWKTINVDYFMLGAGNYFIGLVWETGNAGMKYDSVASVISSGSAYVYDGNVPLTIASATESFKISIYATYSVEPEVTPTPSPSPSPSSTLAPITSGELNNSMLFVLGFMAVFCLVSLVWFGRVPIVPLLIGLFTVLVGLYSALGGVYNLGVAQGWFSLFVAVFGGLSMLLVGLGVRVRK